MKKGTFNQGWWNCFESFAAELLSVDRYAEGICIAVLNGAGITKKEVENWIENYQGTDMRVLEVVRNYWFKHG